MNKQEIEKAIEFLSRYKDDEVYTEQCISSHMMAISALQQQLTNGWIPVTERLPKKAYESGISKDVLVTLVWNESMEINNNQYIGHFDERLYNDYLKEIEENDLDIGEILNLCWTVYKKGGCSPNSCIELTKHRSVIAWHPLPQLYKEVSE